MRIFLLKHPFGRELVIKIGRTTFEFDRTRFEIVTKGKVVLSINF